MDSVIPGLRKTVRSAWTERAERGDGYCLRRLTVARLETRCLAECRFHWATPRIHGAVRAGSPSNDRVKQTGRSRWLHRDDRSRHGRSAAAGARGSDWPPNVRYNTATDSNQGPPNYPCLPSPTSSNGCSTKAKPCHGGQRNVLVAGCQRPLRAIRFISAAAAPGPGSRGNVAAIGRSGGRGIGRRLRRSRADSAVTRSEMLTESEFYKSNDCPSATASYHHSTKYREARSLSIDALNRNPPVIVV